MSENRGTTFNDTAYFRVGVVIRHRAEKYVINVVKRWQGGMEVSPTDKFR